MKNSGLKKYFSSALDELRKVVWPTKNQMATLTALTIGVSGLVTLMIFVLDFLFSELFTYLRNI